ncbi:RNA polymerase sigma-70 factor [Rhabdobacter roseus]|uniref:RNA polymerase sigma-70 factor (ECF subfamily) n=1 Tax=Rhabdobacter roseus TaxID=1655419 RepID=A0A840TY38_9BACT|nr:sigma-70 family RNA polymerase sigma factor [Rhabdobacter roseus]MBB5284559.1 RNA polymerase sigma-70 factor (ECF subfamily) [Rhabdobacter roseus]
MPSYTKISDEALFQLISQDDNRAFEEVYRRYFYRLLNAAYKRLHDRPQAEEMVQELFVALWLKRQSIHLQKNLEVYLHTSLRNLVISHLRKNQRMDYFDTNELPVLNSAKSDAEEQVKYLELKEAYERSILDLPEKCRLAYTLYEDGMSIAEVAEHLHVSPKTIESHLLKARTTLRHRLRGFSAACLLILWLLS